MRIFSLLLVTAAVGALAGPVTAQPAKWSHVGTLDCSMGPSIGLVRGGHQQARCVFKSAVTKQTHRYTGKMERKGHNAGIPSGAKFHWNVLTLTGKVSATALVGNYIDATEQITFEAPDFAGVALCSKSKRVVCLRPAADEGWTRENLAFGTYGLKLE